MTRVLNMSTHDKINYVEFPAKDLASTKRFFSQVFNWVFTDYGPEYTAFSNSGLEGGFFQSEQSSQTQLGSALIVLYSKSLNETQNNIEKAGGVIVKPIFDFPGGQRFHFTDPNGNEFAVWSDI